MSQPSMKHPSPRGTQLSWTRSQRPPPARPFPRASPCRPAACTTPTCRAPRGGFRARMPPFSASSLSPNRSSSSAATGAPAPSRRARSSDTCTAAGTGSGACVLRRAGGRPIMSPRTRTSARRPGLPVAQRCLHHPPPRGPRRHSLTPHRQPKGPARRHRRPRPLQLQQPASAAPGSHLRRQALSTPPLWHACHPPHQF